MCMLGNQWVVNPSGGLESKGSCQLLLFVFVHFFIVGKKLSHAIATPLVSCKEFSPALTLIQTQFLRHARSIPYKPLAFDSETLNANVFLDVF